MSDWIGGRRWEDYPRSRMAEKMTSDERYAEQAYHGPACGCDDCLGKNEGSKEHSGEGQGYPDDNRGSQSGYRENKQGSKELLMKGKWVSLFACIGRGCWMRGNAGCEDDD